MDNFKFLFVTKDAWIMTRNTLLYNIVFIVLGTIVAIFLAVLLCELGNRARVKFFQASLLLPNLLSWVVIGFVAYAFLNADTGFINNTVMKALGKEEISWYTFPKAWPFILVIVNLWKNAGYQSIVYMAGISGIDKSLYEAAALDGATKMQQIFQVTLPLLKPTVITLSLMSIGRIFYSDFGLFYQITQGAQGSIFNAVATIDTYVYNALQSSTPIGMTSAATFFQSVSCCITILLANALVKRIDKDSAII